MSEEDHAGPSFAVPHKDADRVARAAGDIGAAVTVVTGCEAAFVKAASEKKVAVSVKDVVDGRSHANHHSPWDAAVAVH